MEIIRDIKDWSFEEGTTMAIGNFDGIHIGHERLIDAMKEANKGSSLKTVLFTFSNNTHNESKLIYTETEKEEIFREHDINYIFLQDFNKEFSSMTPEAFVFDLLISVFRCKKVVVGFNFRFGYKATGDAKLLGELLAKYGVELIVVDKIVVSDETVSSTYIRDLIQKGKVLEIPNFLGRHYSMEGEVVKGRQVGRTMGFPTANIIPPGDKIILPTGVYFTKVHLRGKKNDVYKGITNIGFNPTFGENKLSVETHILDFEEDIYGEYIKLYFLDKIRNEKKFGSIDELAKQISSDKLYARTVTESRL